MSPGVVVLVIASDALAQMSVTAVATLLFVFGSFELTVQGTTQPDVTMAVFGICVWFWALAGADKRYVTVMLWSGVMVPKSHVIDGGTTALKRHSGVLKELLTYCKGEGMLSLTNTEYALDGPLFVMTKTYKPSPVPAGMHCGGAVFVMATSATFKIVMGKQLLAVKDGVVVCAFTQFWSVR